MTKKFHAREMKAVDEGRAARMTEPDDTFEVRYLVKDPQRCTWRPPNGHTNLVATNAVEPTPPPSTSMLFIMLTQTAIVSITAASL